MNSIKSWLSLIFISLLTITAHGQWGIRGGVDIASFSSKTDGTELSLDSRIGFNAGVTKAIPLASSFYIEPGLFLTGKGYKYTYDYSNSGFNVKGTQDVNISYFEIPVSFKYNIALSGGRRATNFLSLSAGPYFGFGIGGKDKSSTTILDTVINTDEKIKFGSDTTSDFKPMDMGIQFGLGFQFGSIAIGTSYDLGMMNIQPNGDDKNYVKTGTILTYVGYYFGDSGSSRGRGRSKHRSRGRRRR